MIILGFSGKNRLTGQLKIQEQTYQIGFVVCTVATTSRYRAKQFFCFYRLFIFY